MTKLNYEPLGDEHLSDLIPIWSDEEVIRYTNIKAPCTIEEIKDRIQVLKSHDVFVVRQLDEVIGIIGCPYMDQSNAQYGVFYQFKKTSWGQGYATQSTAWLLQFMKNKYVHVTFFADVVTDNIASERILHHFGFTCVSEELGFKRNGINMKIRSFQLKA
jgi:ribosomal-protein-alanine N-acetyltransferase